MTAILLGCASSGNNSSSISLKDEKQDIGTIALKPSFSDGAYSYFVVHDAVELPLKGQVDTSSITQRDGSAVIYYGGFEGFIGGVILQNAIEKTRQSKLESELQKEADRIVEPYKALLNDVLFSRIVSGAVEELTQSRVAYNRYRPSSDVRVNEQVLIQLRPVAVMNYSKDAIQFHSKVTVKAKNKRHDYVLTVHSTPVDDVSVWHAESFWYETFTELTAMTIDLVVRMFNQELEISKDQITIRYKENSRKKVERGFIIDADCQRVLFQSNRKVIKSVVPFRCESS